MSVEVYELISNIGFFIAGIMLVLSIVLFIKFKIPKVYAEISGVAARREIEGISKKNAQERGSSRKLNSIQFQKSKSGEINSFMGKGKKSSFNMNKSEVENKTEVLDWGSYPHPTVENVDNNVEDDFVVEDDIVFIHTDEIIL